MAGFDQGYINDASSGIRIEVRGLTAALKALDLAGADMQDMRDLMHSTGEIAASRARQLVPVKSGTLRATIRAGRGKTKAVIRAGTRTRAPYAPYPEYPGQHLYMTRALIERREQIHTHISEGLKELLKKNRLISF